MNKRIYLSPPHVSGYEMRYVQEAFDTNWIAPLGPNVTAFEEELSEYVGVKHGLALSSGTAGVHLALRCLGVEQGDYVFCSSLTFAGSCNPILYQKAIPVFIDSEPESWNMSPTALEKALIWAKQENKLPKAVIIVDLYGQSADYERLLPICEHYGVPVIEDAAEALGASYRGKKCGTYGVYNIFSFNGNKIITTSGGGMILSNDHEGIEKMKFWATQAREPVRHYEHKEIGYNYRMSNICAGIGRGQLAALDKRISERKAVRQQYVEAFKNLPVEFMPILQKGSPNYWLTVLTVQENCRIRPENIMVALEEKNIESRPIWKPMHLQPIYQPYPFFSHTNQGSLGESLFMKGICLPSGSSMTCSELEKVIDTIMKIFHEG
ncbi:DegT/DnrJ/EryC1/StrS family aminotransferase [Heliobacterium chlorum]|uniref:DegT/DnrJ/EryC1/StrS family aminotransferase n=1 Tax=Heliobacterium chlorum TaxID=2698 RepID=A0ABR7T8B2_HELCL|nr:DegT/DnrJ/EryC1/StrS family aminotransferase [Heliobacterium chlorum]MBC9785841.1 DegT/DnrJ/EryC1/StrS family aminotransferase [Heliobacterium chlorum]